MAVPGARLRYAALDATTLWRINGEGADLRDTSLRDAILWEANLVSARLQRADLSGAHLADARLDDANLRDATLQSVVLLGAVLRGADLTGARLSGIAHGADLRGAKGLTQAQLDRMIGDDRTLLPTGRDPASGRLLDLPNCWAEPPIGFERLIDRLTNAGSIDEGKAIAVERPDGSRVAVSASDLRDLFLCPETDPVRTGTRCPPELPRERCLAIAAGSEDAGWH